MFQDRESIFMTIDVFYRKGPIFPTGLAELRFPPDPPESKPARWPPDNGPYSMIRVTGLESVPPAPPRATACIARAVSGAMPGGIISWAEAGSAPYAF